MSNQDSAVAPHIFPYIKQVSAAWPKRMIAYDFQDGAYIIQGQRGYHPGPIACEFATFGPRRWLESETDSFDQCSNLAFSIYRIDWGAGTWRRRTPPSYIYSMQPQYDGAFADRESFYQPLEAGDEDWAFLDS
ncbi:hypothetical protein DFH06DRAFT_1131765 [Mycena polygramma]|nr:hypothetical protein DFH06DRAFT_1131765 [Mycena polygramma]